MCLIYRRYNNKYHYFNGGEIMKLHEYLDEQEQVNEEGFIVDNEQKANWALRKIKELQQEIEDNTRLAEKEINKIKTWESQQNKSLGDSILYFEGLLHDYAKRKRARSEERREGKRVEEKRREEGREKQREKNKRGN